MFQIILRILVRNDYVSNNIWTFSQEWLCPNNTHVVLPKSGWGLNNTHLYLCSISFLSETQSSWVKTGCGLKFSYKLVKNIKSKYFLYLIFYIACYLTITNPRMRYLQKIFPKLILDRTLIKLKLRLMTFHQT